jgi:hypothetical protein
MIWGYRRFFKLFICVEDMGEYTGEFIENSLNAKKEIEKDKDFIKAIDRTYFNEEMVKIPREKQTRYNTSFKGKKYDILTIPSENDYKAGATMRADIWTPELPEYFMSNFVVGINKGDQYLHIVKYVPNIRKLEYNEWAHFIDPEGRFQESEVKMYCEHLKEKGYELNIKDGKNAFGVKEDLPLKYIINNFSLENFDNFRQILNGTKGEGKLKHLEPILKQVPIIKIS